MASPDSLTETMSFLSSHHSDDFSLMDSESYPDRAPSPSWSSPSSSPASSPISSASVPLPAESESESVSSVTPESSVSYEETRHLRPPASPALSSASSVTARPIPAPDVLRIREMLQDVQEQVGTLWEGQSSTNRMLDDLTQRPAGTDIDTQNRLYRIEEIVHRILEQLSQPPPMPIPEPAPAPPTPVAAPPEPTPVPTPGPAPSVHRDDVSESYATSSSGTSHTGISSTLRRLQDAFRTGFADDHPQLHMPRPVPAGQTFSELLAQTLATDAPPLRSPIQPPPPLVTLQFTPGARGSRARSASPTFETTLPERARSVPLTQPVIFSETRPRPQRIPRQTPHRQHAASPSIAESTPYMPPVMPIPVPGPRMTTPGPTSTVTPVPPPPDNGEDIDMEREVRNLRSQRRPDQPDGIYRPGGPTPPAQVNGLVAPLVFNFIDVSDRSNPALHLLLPTWVVAMMAEVHKRGIHNQPQW